MAATAQVSAASPSPVFGDSAAQPPVGSYDAAVPSAPYGATPATSHQGAVPLPYGVPPAGFHGAAPYTHHQGVPSVPYGAAHPHQGASSLQQPPVAGSYGAAPASQWPAPSALQQSYGHAAPLAYAYPPTSVPASPYGAPASYGAPYGGASTEQVASSVVPSGPYTMASSSPSPALPPAPWDPVLFAALPAAPTPNNSTGGDDWYMDTGVTAHMFAHPGNLVG